MLRKMLQITLYISAGRFRNSLTLARSRLSLILSDSPPWLHASSSTESSIISPNSPIIQIAQQRGTSSFAFSTRWQKIWANIEKSAGQRRRQLRTRGSTLLQREGRGHCSTDLMTVLMMNLASPSSLLRRARLRAATVSALMSSSYKYSASSLTMSDWLSLPMSRSRMRTLATFKQVGCPQESRNRLNIPRNSSAPKLLMRYSMCLSTTYSTSGRSLLRKERSALRRSGRAVGVSVGLSLIILRKILLMASATEGEEVLSLGSSVERIWMISSSVFGSQSSRYCRITGSWKSPKAATLVRRQFQSFLLMAIPSSSISLIASMTVHTNPMSFSLIISQKRLRMPSSRRGVSRVRFFSTISLVRPITHPFLTRGLWSLSPCRRRGYAYSSRPLKRRLARLRMAKARMLGLGDEQSLTKVLMAMRAKFSLAELQMLRQWQMSFFSTKSRVAEASTSQGYNREVSMPDVVQAIIFLISSLRQNSFSGSETMVFKQFLMSLSSFFLLPSKYTSSPVRFSRDQAELKLKF